MTIIKENVYGKDVLPALAEIYPQIYLAPGDEGAEEYKTVVRYGKAPGIKSFSHFIMDERDSCIVENTPAGEIMIVTLHVRKDFETFLNIMANKCVAKKIPKSQGASIIGGIINWQKIRAHKNEYIKSQLACGSQPDWASEFKRVTAKKSNYLDAIIVLSVGAYSGIPAEHFGFKHEEWLEYSHKIRKAHECTHFICRRKYPTQIDAVWDEVVADAVGIIAAFGRYDLVLEEIFLGIDEKGYVGGRLENYVRADELDKAAKNIHNLLLKIAKLAEGYADMQPYDFAVMLEQRQHEWWK